MKEAESGKSWDALIDRRRLLGAVGQTVLALTCGGALSACSSETSPQRVSPSHSIVATKQSAAAQPTPHEPQIRSSVLRERQEQARTWDQFIQIFADEAIEKAVYEGTKLGIDNTPTAGQLNSGIRTESKSASSKFPIGEYGIYYSAHALPGGGFDADMIDVTASQLNAHGSGRTLMYAHMQRSPKDRHWEMQLNPPAPDPRHLWVPEYYRTDGTFSYRAMQRTEKAIIYILNQAISPEPHTMSITTLPNLSIP